MKDNNSLFVIESTNMSTIGITYMSLGVTTFKSLKSTQTLSFQFFFITRTIFANHYTYLIGLMNLDFKSFSIFIFTFSSTSLNILLGGC